MKQIPLLILIAAGIAACTPANKDTQPKGKPQQENTANKNASIEKSANAEPAENTSSENAAENPANGNPSNKPRIDPGLRIVPGKSIGKLFLNQDMENVFHIMGKADAGDAAMGKAWSIWLSKTAGNQTKDQIAVFSSYKDTSMTRKSAKEILVTASKYRTDNGLKAGMSLDSIKMQLPSLKQVARYVNDSKHDTLVVYDDIQSGIAFDTKAKGGKQISTAVYVHLPKESVNNTYLTIYPGWRKLGY